MFVNILTWLSGSAANVFSIIAISIGALLLIVSLRTEKKKQLWRDFHHHDQVPKQKLAWLDRLSVSLNNLLSADKQQVQQKLLAAGFYHPKLTTYFMPLKYSLLLIGCGAWYALSVRLAWQGNSLFIALAIWLVVSLILPDSYLAMRGRQLSYKISAKLPYLLDLMAVCVQTGMTIEASISYLAKEMKGFDKDISYLLIKTDDRARMVGLEAALDELYARVPSNEMRSFVMTLKQSLQYGSSIYNVLTTLSADIREVQMLNIEEKIGKLAAKMSIPLIVFIMVPIVILIAAPGIMRMMANA